MSEYPAGTVAVATVRGVEGVRVFRTCASETGASAFWVANYPSHRVVPVDSEVTDIRPLVVLDLDPDDANWAVMVLRNPGIEAMGTRKRIADQIEAQTKPPRIPEPGQFAIVKASCSCDSERVTWASLSCMWVDRGGDRHGWDDLIDPTLVREGIES